MRALAGRYRLLILTAAALGGVALVALLSTGGAVRVCPVGQRLVRGEGDAHERAAGDYESHFKGRCAPVAHPESDRDLARFSEYAASRQGADTPREFARAVRQRQRMERSPARVAG